MTETDNRPYCEICRELPVPFHGVICRPCREDAQSATRMIGAAMTVMAFVIGLSLLAMGLTWVVRTHGEVEAMRLEESVR